MRREAALPDPYADGSPFAFAGLWERWRGDGEATVESCTILTSTPNELVARIHDRMPVILPRADHARWLDPGAELDALRPLLRPHPAAGMTAFPVLRLVPCEHPLLLVGVRADR